MKSEIVSMFAFACLMVACNAKASDMPDIAKQNDCAACHAMDKKIVGPAFMEISKKYKGATQYTYKGKEYPLVEGLMMKVSNGGQGNWKGWMPMPAIDPKGKKQEQIKKLVEYVLGLAKE